MREAEFKGMPDGEDSTHDLEKETVKERDRVLGSQGEEGRAPNSSKCRTEESTVSWEDRFRCSPAMQFQYFEDSLYSGNWELSKKLILLVDDEHGLSRMLIVALCFIWVLKSAEDLNSLTGLIKEIIRIGTHILTRDSISRCFVISCVFAGLHRMGACLKDASNMLQRFEELIQETKEEIAGSNPEDLDLLESCLIGFKTCLKVYMDFWSSTDKVTQSAITLQLSAFNSFLDLAGDQITRDAITEAFCSVCDPIILFYDTLESDWASGASARGARELLGVLVERGAEHADKSFIAASCNGSIEVVRILLQLAQQYNLDLDVNEAFAGASQFCMISTMQCLVDEGNAVPSGECLKDAAARGCMEVVQWYVNRGCTFEELSTAFVSATCNNQVDIVEYILPSVPQEVISANPILVLEKSGPNVVAFLLRSNFVGNLAVTYTTANNFAMSEDLPPQLRLYLREHWTEAAFNEGVSSWKEHYVNFMRVLRRGQSPIQLKQLPQPLVAAMLYLPLYQECIKAGGPLLPQRLRGQLVEAVRTLGNQVVINGSEREELLAVLEHHLHPFLLAVKTV